MMSPCLQMASIRAVVLLVVVQWCCSDPLASQLRQPHLCEKLCECMDGQPYMVDCSQFDLLEVPMKGPDDYPLEWFAKLGGNRISRVPVIPKQDNLIMLSFKSNNISALDDGAFSELTALRSLVLSDNCLTGRALSQHVFRGPFNKDDGHDPIPLESLDLSYNKLDVLDSHAFMHLSHLTSLIISNNPLHDLSHTTANAFTELVGLVLLDLSRTQLRRIPDHFLSGMRNLEELILEGNMMTTVPEELSFSLSLKTIILDNNPIVTLTASSFVGPATLTTLSLSHMPRLHSIEAQALGGAAALRVLRVTDNVHLRALHKLAFLGPSNNSTSLREVYLQNNQLTRVSEDLLPWEQLERLDLQGNPWRCDCHLKWIVTSGLIQTMVELEPKLTRSIICASPEAVQGQNLKALVAQEHEFVCDPSPLPHNASFYWPIILITIFIGVVLLISATIMFSYILYQRAMGGGSSKAVHYRRARETDLEAIATNLYS